MLLFIAIIINQAYVANSDLLYRRRPIANIKHLCAYNMLLFIAIINQAYVANSDLLYRRRPIANIKYACTAGCYSFL